MLLIAGCSSTEFKSFEGKNNFYEGRGGTKVSIEGIDFWDNGEPPRKYKILGVIDDERAGNLIHRATFKSDVAKKAKESGGDAVIDLGSSSQVTGYVSNAYASGQYGGGTASSSGFGGSAAVTRTKAKFAVVKYLD